MRVRIPRAVQRCGNAKYTVFEEENGRDPYGGEPLRKYPINLGCCLYEDTELVEMDSYFWNTHHLPMNDVVHSKIVADGQSTLTPNLVIAGSNNLFPSRVMSYGEFVYDKDPPFAIGEDILIDGCPTWLFVNNVNECYSIRFSFPWSDGRFWAMIQVEYYTAVYGSSRYVYKCSASCQAQFDGDKGDQPLFPPNGWLVKFRPTGRVTKSGNAPNLDELASLAQVGGMGLSAVMFGYNRQYYIHRCKGLFDELLHDVEAIVKTWSDKGRKSKYKGWTRYTYKTDLDLSIPDLVPYHKRFLLHEDFIIAEGGSSLISGNAYSANFWREWLIQSSYLDALNSTPTLNDNSISNILEIVGFMKSLIIDRKIDIPKRLGDIWLSYRYTYGTTKMDAEEAIAFVHRYCDLGTLDQWIHCFGSARHTYSNADFTASITCRCGLKIRPRDVAMLDKLWRSLYTYGLQPNFYVIWDSIPYSFIVDWFIPIGNLAKAWDAESMYDGTYYEIKDVVFSLSYDITDEYHNTYHQYSRWHTDGVPRLNGFYQLIEDPASTRVIGMRILDAASLFIGKGKKHG
jgi:hypothetical protein